MGLASELATHNVYTHPLENYSTGEVCVYTVMLPVMYEITSVAFACVLMRVVNTVIHTSMYV